MNPDQEPPARACDPDTPVIHRTYSRIPHRLATHGARRGLRLSASLVGALMMMLSARPGSVQAPGSPAAPPAGPRAPDAKVADVTPFRVVVLVSSYGGMDTVSILFPASQPHDQVARIVTRLGELGGWQPVDVRIKDHPFVSFWQDATENHPAAMLQTFVEFGAPGVINHREHWINLDPFILGLKDYTPLRVALALADDIAVTGPGNVTNNTVQIECSRQPNSVVFDITVKDSDLTATGVPTHPPTPPVSPTPTRPAPPPRRTPLYMLATGVLAAVAALALAARRKGIGPWATKRSACVPAGGSPAGAVGNEREDQGGD